MTGPPFQIAAAPDCPDLPGREPGQAYKHQVRYANPQRNPVILRRVLNGLENLPDYAPIEAAS